ncbi:hypothetical protein [Kineococcus sp. G2]|uniref:hypothetical protein n=1 Tax=Kineococcus sp. G2 TaxID=3127484 RepID=UPI00301CB4EB
MGEGSEMSEVHLLKVPLALREALNEHAQELLRELALVQIGAGHDGAPALPQRLLQVAEELESSYAPFQQQPVAALDAAARAGQDFADVTYTLPAQAAAFAQRVLDVLEEADDFCREQQLLTLPASAQLVAYRRWLFGQFIRQLSGAPPQPWTGIDTPAHAGEQASKQTVGVLEA